MDAWRARVGNIVMSLSNQLERTWADIHDLIALHPTSFGPPELLRYELSSLKAAIDAARESEDDEKLRRCLEQARILSAKLKCLVPDSHLKPSPDLSPAPELAPGPNLTPNPDS